MDIHTHEIRGDKYVKWKQLRVRSDLDNDGEGPTCSIEMEMYNSDGDTFGRVTLYIKHRETLVGLRDIAKGALQHFDKPR